MEEGAFHETFLAEGFWPAFEKDLRGAQARVIVSSPFITSRRVMLLQSSFQFLLDRNVRLCFFLQPPSRVSDIVAGQRKSTPSERAQEEDARNMIHWLEGQGAHLNLRPRIHEKIAIIDKAVLWEGSLNILSHKNTEERMRRIKSERETQKAINDHRLNLCERCLELARVEGDSVRTQLVHARKTLRLSQRELANFSGVSQTFVARLEKGEQQMSMESAEKICKALGYRIVVLPDWVVPTVFNVLEKVDRNLRGESISDSSSF